MERRLAVALGVSLLLHAAVVVSPGWRGPSEQEPEQPLIEARLAPAPPDVSPKPAAPRPRPPRPRPAPATPQVPQARLPEPEAVPGEASTPSPEPAPVATQEPAAPAAQEAAPPLAPVVSRAWPSGTEVPLPGEGRIRYAVMLGAQGFVVGDAVLTWRLDGNSYSIRNVAGTVGLASLFHRAKVVQVSTGELTVDGLMPKEYSMVRDNSGIPSEAAYFDWNAHRILLVRGSRQTEKELLEGSQDILSMVYQLALFPPAESRMEIPVATGKSYNRQFFQVVGEERLALRLGEFRALHLQVGLPGESTTELWMALDYRNLPLRIRFTDRSKDVYEEVATAIEFQDVNLTEPARRP